MKTQREKHERHRATNDDDRQNGDVMVTDVCLAERRRLLGEPKYFNTDASTTATNTKVVITRIIPIIMISRTKGGRKKTPKKKKQKTKKSP